MNNSELNSLLKPLARRQRVQSMAQILGSGVAVVLVFNLGGWLIQRCLGIAFGLPPWVNAVACLVSVAVTVVRTLRRRPDPRALAILVERRYPDLDGLLLTAIQQPDSSEETQNLLQRRLVNAAIHHGRMNSWEASISGVRLGGWILLTTAVLAVSFVVAGFPKGASFPSRSFSSTGNGLKVSPGDTEIERGSSLVVIADVAGGLPSAVDLVIGNQSESERRIALAKSLADPVFGGSISDVQTGFVYHVEYPGTRSKDFTVKVYEHPRLARADVELNFPDYTKSPKKRIEDTRRISAVEGSRIDLALQLNQPVKQARLIPRGHALSAITFQIDPDRSSATLTQFLLQTNGVYDLLLVNAEGRTNKVPSVFIFDALKNRTPEIHLVAPRGDLRPSPLEEVVFEGTVWDDFGIRAYGIAYGLAGKETRFIHLGRDIPGGEKRAFRHLLSLEELGVQPDQLLTWFVWADDIGPDGLVRRTTGDLFFAEVRPFDEIFRQGQEAAGSEAQAQQQQAGGGNQTSQLADLEKQIVSATWKLQRDLPNEHSPQHGSDVGVVIDSQEQALVKAKAQLQKAAKGRSETLWSAVVQNMVTAASELMRATNSPSALTLALAAEQTAYQALLKVQAREHEVTRNRGQSGNPGASQKSQRQIDQLDLKQTENRYETQRQAKGPQSAQQQEQSQVLNRLQELARRQQDLNDRLKEVQASLQQARSEPEKEELRRQLKRLQEEQREMLAGVDELQQRMSRPENQERLSAERRQLDQARDELKKAADAASTGALGQAVSSGVRAQRQLQEMRENLRRQSSSQFSDQMRDLRNQVRELTKSQEEISRKLQELERPGRKLLASSTSNLDLLKRLESQKQKLTNVIQQASQISQVADSAEPLLSKRLYDAVRKFHQQDATTSPALKEELLKQGQLTRGLNQWLDENSLPEGQQAIELTGELIRQGLIPQASEAGKRSLAEVEDLRQGLEKAAESVLGDESESLRLAKAQLDTATEELKREMEREGGGLGESKPASDASANSKRSSSAGDPPDSSGAKRDSTEVADGIPMADSPNSEPEPTLSAGKRTQRVSALETQKTAPNGQASEGNKSSSAGQGTQGTGAPQASEGMTSRGRGRATSGNRDPNGEGRQSGGSVGLGEMGNPRSGEAGGGPIAGGTFGPWSDRLRDAEEILDAPDLKSAVAAAREQARLTRLDFKRSGKKPDWASVKLKVMQPLVEVRSRLAEELAHRGSREALVPIDRDPVPARYAESVRGYYERLGRENPPR
jgi:hypothetical protein